MTVGLFYKDAYLNEAKAKIESLEIRGNKVRLNLDRTIFYPEGGGQPSDKGIIRGDGFEIRVEKVYGKDEIWHEGTLKGREPKPGEEVELELDWEWRYENMKQHTGQHILSAVLKDLYDSNTTGFQIFENYNKIEINFNGKLTWEHILNAEIRANEIVSKDLPVEIEFYNELPEDLRNQLRKDLSDKIKPPIRIVSIPGVDVIPCGGTHVKSTREVGFIKVVNFYKKSKNIWRIEFVCGNRALRYLDELLEDYWESLDEMPNKNRPLIKRVRELKNEIVKLEEEKKALRLELWEWKAKALLKESEEVKGIKIVSTVEELDMKDAQAFVVYLVDKNPNTIALFVGRNYVIFAKNRGVEGVSMKELLREVIKETGGGGGGGEVLAKGGGFRVEPEKVLEIAKEKLKQLLQV
ncbi:alanyl-tRNA editing protein [Thermococcus barophilus]|uniref:Alanyl-tRNA editing protein AlaX-L n=1 Tax=Thermococcus barophilus TaxID=55802 RepID=A0A0S1XDD6_THEBA|nr:DHHA1 domain-containing protein [Thermococcus barophilus]ALM75778.1 Alanyl-tRNA editing protein AlaX-L [Thermococcus barophilus]